MKRSKRQERIDRLVNALAYYDSQVTEKRREPRHVIQEIRYQFLIGPKTMRFMLLARVGGLNAQSQPS